MRSTKADPKLRHAATVIVVRESEDGFEVLLLRRSKALDFAADAYVFPGGSVDTEDRLVWEDGLAKVSNPESLASQLNLDVTTAMSHYVAAIREVFEETGILLAHPRPSFLQSARGELLANKITFHSVVSRHNLTLSLDRLTYVAHWITPEAVPKRFDTRFFFALVSRDDTATEDMSEIVAHEWITPENALARFQEGSLRLVLPTVRNIEFLAKHRTLAELTTAVAQLGPIPTIMPRMLRTKNGVVPIEPSDPRYDAVSPTTMGPDEGLPMSPRGLF